MTTDQVSDDPVLGPAGSRRRGFFMPRLFCDPVCDPKAK